MKYTASLTKYAPPGILASSLLLLYWDTMAPGLTWAHQGSDGGDLITAAAVGGVAHPTGYPVYLIIARVFQLLPLGSLAYRTNIMSAVFAVLAALLVYGVVTKYLSDKGVDHYWLPGIIAAYSFGLAPILWSQAVITEVYTLHAFFIALILYLFLIRSSSWIDRLRGVVLGLAMGNHITSIFLLPAAIWLSALEKDAPAQLSDTTWAWMKSVRLSSIRRQLTWMLIGLSIYMILPLRAVTSPAINWGNPVNPKNFWGLVSGSLYQAHYLGASIDVFWGRSQALASLLLEQFGLLGLLVAAIGAVVFFQVSRLHLITLWCFISFSIFAFAYNTVDSYLYLIPALISLSIWIGLGVGGLLEISKNRFRILVIAAVFTLLVYILGLSRDNYQAVDASGDFRAEIFGKVVMEQAPDNAIIFAEGDQAVFTLWYFHFALKERPDIAVISADLLHYDWYQGGIRSQYPSLILPNAFLLQETVIASNPKRPICYIDYGDRADIHCSQGHTDDKSQ